MSKVILVTGCSKGSAGAALAEEFHGRGHHVFATSTNGSKMQNLADIGITTLALDVTSQSSIDAAVASVRAATGKLDVLINNAAIFRVMPLADESIDAGRKMFDANVFGLLAVTQAFLPLLIAANGTGIVANVSSISASLCPPWQGMYAASKAAVSAMSNVMRLELAPLGVKVVTIMSGGVDTVGLRESSRQPDRVPETSYYKALAHAIETNEAGTKMKAMEAREYAKGVADDLLRTRPGLVLWRGSFAWVAWFLARFGWVGIMDAGMIEQTGLGRVRRMENDGGSLKEE